MKKKLISILLLSVLLIFLLCSCASTGTVDEVPNVPERYVEGILEYKNSLKDPASMRVYGDVVVAHFVETDTYVISIVCDAKNSFGAYSGKKNIEIIMSTDLDPFFVDNESDYYLSIRETYENYDEITDEDLLANLDSQIEFELYSGEDIAELIEAEYFSV